MNGYKRAHIGLKLSGLCILTFTLAASQCATPSNTNETPAPTRTPAPVPQTSSSPVGPTQLGPRPDSPAAPAPATAAAGPEDSASQERVNQIKALAESSPERALRRITQEAEQAQAGGAAPETVMNKPDLTGTRWTVHVMLSGAWSEFGTLEFGQARPRPGGGHVSVRFASLSGAGGQMQGTYDGNSVTFAHRNPQNAIMVMAARLPPGRAQVLEGFLITEIPGQAPRTYQMTAYAR